MPAKEDRPSQDELRSLFNDYLTGKRKAAPAPAAPPPKKAQPQRPARPPRPAPPPKPVESLPPDLDPAQLQKLKIMKGALPPPVYRRILALPDLEKDPAAFLGRWDRLLNGFGMKGAAAIALGETKPDDACVSRLAQLLRCGPEDSKRLAALEEFATLPLERRALIIRDRVARSAKRWDSPQEAVIGVMTGRMTEGELAARLLSRKLRIDAPSARTLLARQPAGEPVQQAQALSSRLLQEAVERKAALSEVVAATLETIRAEELLSGTVARELAIPEDLAARLCDRPAVKPLPPAERGRRSVEETQALAGDLGCPAEQAARLHCGLLPQEELDDVVGRALAATLSIEPALGSDLARLAELRALPPRERARKGARRVEALAEELRCSAAEAAALLLGKPAAGSLPSMLQARLGLGAAAAEALAGWLREQPGPLAESALAVLARVQETAAAARCTPDQAALLVGGRVTPADLRASHLGEELGVSPELAKRLVAWLDAEKVSDAEAKARIRNLRSWAARTADEACGMLIKEIPTPTKSDSDALPFSGAWE